MTGKQLKNSILQWAIQGKLVPQDPNDEPASVLLEKIRAEKARLIKEGKIKKDKKESIIYRGEDNSYYEKFADGLIVCIDDEVPFEIPSTWEWRRLSSLFQINPKNTVEDNADAAFIPMEKIDATYQSNFSYSVRKWHEIKSGFTHFADGDVAFAKITPCFQNRKSMILKGLPNGIGAGTTELKVLRTYGNTISTEYLLFFLESPYFVEEAIFKGTANQQRIISGYLENKLFPIPPQKEQQRIVDIINASFTVAETYSKAQEKLDSLNNSLTASLRKSILQEAIQGKLVPQDPNDEPASFLLQRIKDEKLRLIKEGKLKKMDIIDSTIFRGDDNKYYEQTGSEITCIDNIVPFDLPASWCWVRHNQLFEVSGGSQPPKSHFIDHYKEGYIRLYQIRDYGSNPVPVYVPKDEISKTTRKGDILLARYGGSLGKVFWAEEGAYNVAMAKVIPLYKSDSIYNEYIFLYYCSSIYQSTIIDHSRSAQAGFNKDDLADMLFPLPPFAEQARIVERYKSIVASIMSR